MRIRGFGESKLKMPGNVGRGSIVAIANFIDVIAMTSAACRLLKMISDRV